MKNYSKKLQLVDTGNLNRILKLLTSQIENNQTIQELKDPDLKDVLKVSKNSIHHKTITWKEKI